MATVRKCAWLGGLAAALISVSAAAAKVDVLPGDNIGYDTDRIALVMGNSDYEHIVDLDNTVNDSRAVADALRKVGFKVFRAENMTRRDMNDAIDAYLAAVTPGSEALIYYAGHGLEVAGENYLLPTDIRRLLPSQQRRLREDSVSLNRLMDDLRVRGARVNLVLLDACRDNPFPREATRSLGSAVGLGRVDPPQGTVVVYAAAAGERALDKLSPDDPNPNGLFTRHLLDLIGEPGLEIRSLVQELKERVYTEAKTASLQTQRPSYYDGLIGKFYFRPEAEAVELKHPCEVLVDPNANVQTVRLNDYQAAIRTCQQAIASFPNKALFRDLLTAAEEQLAVQTAITSDETDSARFYLARYGEGRYRDVVTAHLASLDPETKVASIEQPAVAGARAFPSEAGPAVPKNGLTPTVQPANAAAEPQVTGPTPTATTEVAALSTVGKPEIQAPNEGLPILRGKPLIVALQTELNRIGCTAGRADGIWGRRSQAALRAYGDHGGTLPADGELDMDMLAALKQETGRVCPLVCNSRQVLQGGRCVAKTCPSGQRLSSRGQCYTPRKQTASPCRAGQKRNSKGVCYTPRRAATTQRRTTGWQDPPARTNWREPTRKTNRKPDTNARGRAMSPSGSTLRCEGAGPGLC